VMTAAGEYIELQGTAEGKSYSRGELNQLLDLANKGIGELLTFQSEVLASRNLNS
jgi:ribonuclease PH